MRTYGQVSLGSLSRTGGLVARRVTSSESQPPRSMEALNLATLQAELHLRTSCLGADHPGTLSIVSSIAALEREAESMAAERKAADARCPPDVNTLKACSQQSLEDVSSGAEDGVSSGAEDSFQEGGGLALCGGLLGETSGAESTSDDDQGNLSDHSNAEEAKVPARTIVAPRAAPSAEFPGSKRQYRRRAAPAQPHFPTPAPSYAPSPALTRQEVADTSGPVPKRARPSATSDGTSGHSGAAAAGVSASDAVELEVQRRYFEDLDAQDLSVLTGDGDVSVADSSLVLSPLVKPRSNRRLSRTKTKTTKGASSASSKAAAVLAATASPVAGLAMQAATRNPTVGQPSDAARNTPPPPSLTPLTPHLQVIAAYAQYSTSVESMGVSPIPLQEFARHRSLFVYADQVGNLMLQLCFELGLRETSQPTGGHSCNDPFVSWWH